MDRPSSIPPTVSLKDVKELHREIIGAIHESGHTYERIASILSIKPAAVLRHYMRRDLKALPRYNGVLKAVHESLLKESESIRQLVSPILVEKYELLTSGQTRNVINYQLSARSQVPEQEDESQPIEHSFSDNTLYNISRIIHDFFRIDYRYSMNTLKRIRGTYYLYRPSIRGAEIVKSMLKIGSREDNELFVDFVHYHPDRYFINLETTPPRVATGIALHLANNIFLIGTTENGQAVDFFGLREPTRADFHIIAGFNLTTNLDRILIGPKVVLIRDRNACLGGIARIPLNDFNPQTEKFKKEILANGCPSVADVREMKVANISPEEKNNNESLVSQKGTDKQPVKKT